MPIGTVFNGSPRLVRDLAQQFGKDVEFLVDGQDTEIDRTVIGRIRDPLVHRLRNSIDHGAEGLQPKAVETGAHKGPTGRLFMESGKTMVASAGQEFRELSENYRRPRCRK